MLLILNMTPTMAVETQLVPSATHFDRSLPPEPGATDSA